MKSCRRFVLILVAVLLSYPRVLGQMKMPGMSMPQANAAQKLLMQQASGTAVNPASSSQDMFSLRAGEWNLMGHGQAFLNDTQQTGPRGADKLFSTNWFMGMAEHPVGAGGSFMFRAMISLEPATITKRRYPELFQTGETAYGRPLVDAQHPHDLFMEISLQYARQVADGTVVDFYAAPVGDPALGPVAFPHRLSAAEIPQAPLSHHLQDSTHIANDVITAGIKHRMFRIEASGFHGAEPDENRWNIDYGAVDSWASRLTLTPTDNIVAQVSAGRLKKPEAFEAGDIIRSTASLTYNRPVGSGYWASSLIWGRNHKTAGDRNLNSYLAESVLRFKNKNYVTGRIELVDKDELFSDQPDIEELLARTTASVFRIAAYTVGFTRDVRQSGGIALGLGINATTYSIPQALKGYYGSHPAAFLFYVRIRLASGANTKP